MAVNLNDVGYIYCLSNPSFEKDIFKIGFTQSEPEIRKSQLQTTGVPTPFKLEFAKKVNKYQEKEKTIHKILSEYRVNEKREFFKISLPKIKDLFDLVDGETYKETVENPQIGEINDTKILDNYFNKYDKSELLTALFYKNCTWSNLIKNFDTLQNLNLTQKKYLLIKYDELPNTEKEKILWTYTRDILHCIANFFDKENTRSNTNKKDLVDNLLKYKKFSHLLDIQNVHIQKYYEDYLTDVIVDYKFYYDLLHKGFFIPEKYWTCDFYEYFMVCKCWYCYDVPLDIVPVGKREKLITENLIYLYLIKSEHCCYFLQIPEILRTEKICKLYIMKKGKGGLQHIPETMKERVMSDEICKLAIKYS